MSKKGNVGIYCWTNILNNKRYIGQSINLTSRYKQHVRRYNSKQYSDFPLYQDMCKFGIDNFSYEVLERCSRDQLDGREIYYIDKYNSLMRGYNRTLGGGMRSPHLVPETVRAITDELQTSSETYQVIAEKFNTTSRTIRAINTGETWKRQHLDYPINKTIGRGVTVTTYCKYCGDIIGKGSQRCVPCHAIEQRRVNRPDKITLAKLVNDIGFRGVGQMYGVTDSAIRKWCQSVGLGNKKSEVIQWFRQQDNAEVV